MKSLLLNAFSINMINDSCEIEFRKTDPSEMEKIMNTGNIVNGIGHADTNAVVAGILALDGIDIGEGCRGNYNIADFDNIFVAQYTGPRLPEGTKSLPDGAKIEFWQIVLKKKSFKILFCANDVGGSLCSGGVFNSLAEAKSNLDNLDYLEAWIKDEEGNIPWNSRD